MISYKAAKKKKNFISAKNIVCVHTDVNIQTRHVSRIDI